MVKHFLAVIALFSVSTLINAQTAPAATTPNSAPVEKMGKHRDGMKGGKHIKETLGLTDEQAQKFKAIAGDYAGKIKAVKTDNSIDKATTKQKIQDLRASEQSEIKALLNADQYAKYQQMIADRELKMKGMGKMHDGAPKPAPKN